MTQKMNDFARGFHMKDHGHTFITDEERRRMQRQVLIAVVIALVAGIGAILYAAHAFGLITRSY